MEINNLAVNIILLFLPGILSWFILEKLIISKKRAFSYYIIYSFLLGFLSYFSYFGLLNLANLIFNRDYQVNFFNLLLNSGETLNSTAVFKEIFFVSLLALIIAVVLAAIINKRWFHLILQKLRITKRFSEPDLWSWLVNSDDFTWVYIRDYKNNKSYRGKIDSYSDTLGEIAELLLHDVSVFNNETGGHLYDAKAVYLARESNNFTIEFTEDYRI